MRYVLIITTMLSSSAFADPVWTTETHNDVTYSRSNDGQVLTTETHNGVTYTRSKNGEEWTTETHNGVTTTRKK